VAAMASQDSDGSELELAMKDSEVLAEMDDEDDRVLNAIWAQAKANKEYRVATGYYRGSSSCQSTPIRKRQAVSPATTSDGGRRAARRSSADAAASADGSGVVYDLAVYQRLQHGLLFGLKNPPVTRSMLSLRLWRRSLASERTFLRESGVDKARRFMGETACTATPEAKQTPELVITAPSAVAETAVATSHRCPGRGPHASSCCANGHDESSTLTALTAASVV